MYLAPRGIGAVIEKLKQTSVRFVVSGSWAAFQVAPVAPPRLLLVYVDKPTAAAGDLDFGQPRPAPTSRSRRPSILW